MKNECKNVFIQFKKSYHPLSQRRVKKVNKAYSFISRDGHHSGKLDTSAAGQLNVVEAAVPGRKQPLLGLGSRRIVSNQNLKNQDRHPAPAGAIHKCIPSERTAKAPEVSSLTFVHIWLWPFSTAYSGAGLLNESMGVLWEPLWLSSSLRICGSISFCCQALF